jgi:catechol 2,3-dioxygenase
MHAAAKNALHCRSGNAPRPEQETMTIALTRRTLLRLAGTTSLAMAAAAAAQAEGPAPVVGPGFAGSTPIRCGAIGLRVRDLDRMSRYYQSVLGLGVISASADGVVLGAGGVPLVWLEPRPQAGYEPRNAAGLFHTAFLMPSRHDLARWLVHVARNQTPLTGFADHSVSEAVYLDDPEGNGIEVYADRDPRLWRWEGERVVMGTHRLDVDGILSLTDTGRNDYTSAPTGLRIGHMHLRVGDIAQSEGFYRDAIGLDSTSRRDTASFLSSGRYHHHVALNTWNSAGAGPRDRAQTGLDWFSLEVADPALLATQRERMAKAGYAPTTVARGFESTDPWGTRLRLVGA